jgi:two-component system, NarL family, sensor histidine kinase DesK
VSAEREPLRFSSSHGRQRGGSSPSPDSAYESPDQTALNEIRRDLHDVVGNALVCMAMELEQLARTGHADHSKVQVMIAELRDETADLINHVRRLAHGHTTHRVEDVEMALGTMISRINHKVGPRLTFTLSYDPAVRLVPADIRSAAFWITREAIINVLKHSQARNCAVSLTVSGAFLRIQVEDDGVMPAQRQGGGRGLTNMAERAAEHGGWCRASRLQPRGFAVLASLPAFPRGTDSKRTGVLKCRTGMA